MKSVPFVALDPALYREVVRRALAEDLGWGDLTTEATVPADLRARGALLARSDFVLAGLEVAEEVFRQLDPRVSVVRRRTDGQWCHEADVIALIEGFATSLLTAERTALNFLQRMCGIATATRRCVDAAGGRITVLDTRKTVPTLRLLDKYAVRAGGGVNHRLTLDEGLLIKDNHVRLAGGVTEAFRRLRAAGHEMPIEVEIQSLAELDEALEAGATLLLVDNLPLADVREAVRRTRGRAKIEVSGSVTLERLPEIAETGAEYVSIGALTHSVKAADISFELERSAGSESDGSP